MSYLYAPREPKPYNADRNLNICRTPGFEAILRNPPTRGGLKFPATKSVPGEAVIMRIPVVCTSRHGHPSKSQHAMSDRSYISFRFSHCFLPLLVSVFKRSTIIHTSRDYLNKIYIQYAVRTFVNLAEAQIERLLI